MYADVESRGGILEPPGICEVKFRAADQITKMHEVRWGSESESTGVPKTQSNSKPALGRYVRADACMHGTRTGGVQRYFFNRTFLLPRPLSPPLPPTIVPFFLLLRLASAVNGQLDPVLKGLDADVATAGSEEDVEALKAQIKSRENALLPIYLQVEYFEGKRTICTYFLRQWFLRRKCEYRDFPRKITL